MPRTMSRAVVQPVSPSDFPPGNLSNLASPAVSNRITSVSPSSMVSLLNPSAMPGIRHFHVNTVSAASASIVSLVIVLEYESRPKKRVAPASVPANPQLCLAQGPGAKELQCRERWRIANCVFVEHRFATGAENQGLERNVIQQAIGDDNHVAFVGNELSNQSAPSGKSNSKVFD